MLKIILLSIVMVLNVVTADDCLGCAGDAEVDQKIVNFALAELMGSEGGVCKKKVLKVENFKKQVNKAFDQF